VDDPPALADAGLDDADGAVGGLPAFGLQLGRPRVDDPPRRREGLRDAADPGHVRQLLQRLPGVQGAVGDPVAQARVGLELPGMRLDKLAEARRAVGVAAGRRHQQGDARPVLDHPLQDHRVQVGPVVAAVALLDLDHARRRRRVAAVVIAVDREAGRVQVAARAVQAQLPHHPGCQQVIKQLHAEGVNGIQGASQGNRAI